MPIIPSDGHRPDVFHRRTMLLVCVASLVLLVLGRWGLSWLGGSTVTPSVAHHEPAVVPVGVPPPPESPPGNASHKPVPPPSADGPEGAEPAESLADEADDPDPGASVSAPAPPPVTDSHLSPRSQALVAKLLDESEFALGGVGYGGAMSTGEKLTRQLSHRADAIAAFDWLANQRRPVSQLYAYWALRTLAPGHAQAHAAELRRDRRRVLVFYGCMGSRHRISDLMREVEQRAMPAP